MTGHPNFKSTVPGISNFSTLNYYLGSIFDNLNTKAPRSSAIHNDLKPMINKYNNIIWLTNEIFIMTTPSEKYEMKTFYDIIPYYNNYEKLQEISDYSTFVQLKLKLEQIDTLYGLHISNRDCLLFSRMEINGQYFYTHIYTQFIFHMSITYLHLIFITKNVNIFFKLLLAYPKYLTYKFNINDNLCKNIEYYDDKFFDLFPRLENFCMDTLLKYNVNYCQLPSIIIRKIEWQFDLKNISKSWIKIIKYLNKFVVNLIFFNNKSLSIWKDDIHIYCIYNNNNNIDNKCTCLAKNGIINTFPFHRKSLFVKPV